MFQLLAWYPSNELSPRSTDPRNLHFAFRKEILVNIGALVVNATPGSDAASRRVKVREGLKLWLRVLALLSHREASSPPPSQCRLADELAHRGQANVYGRCAQFFLHHGSTVFHEESEREPLRAIRAQGKNLVQRFGVAPFGMLGDD